MNILDSYMNKIAYVVNKSHYILFSTIILKKLLLIFSKHNKVKIYKFQIYLIKFMYMKFGIILIFLLKIRSLLRKSK